MLELRAVSVRHVGPVDFGVDAGECVGLSGPSGAGKTLLLRAVADLEPHGGDCLLDGAPATAMAPAEWRRRVAYLAAESAWWHDTVGPHFAAGIDAHALTALGFTDAVMGWSVARLSSGERQRLALLRLLAGHPRALLLDEPTTNLDTANAAAVEALIADYRKTRKACVLWVAHDRAQLARVARRDAQLNAQGTLAWS